MAAAAWVAVAAATLARTSWVAASQAQSSCQTRAGSPERRHGVVAGPAPVTVVLFSPIVVSEADQRMG